MDALRVYRDYPVVRNVNGESGKVLERNENALTAG